MNYGITHRNHRSESERWTWQTNPNNTKLQVGTIKENKWQKTHTHTEHANHTRSICFQMNPQNGIHNNLNKTLGASSCAFRLFLICHIERKWCSNFYKSIDQTNLQFQDLLWCCFFYPLTNLTKKNESNNNNLPAQYMSTDTRCRKNNDVQRNLFINVRRHLIMTIIPVWHLTLIIYLLSKILIMDSDMVLVEQQTK